MWRLIIYLFWFVLSSSVGAEIVLPSASENSANYQIKHWTADDGLPQNRIACLKQTHDGYLWIGTWFGLARFDGMKFTVFDKANTPEFASDAISSLAEDREGTLWVGTKNGLLKYTDGQFHRLTTADGLPYNEIWQLAPARDGGIWMQSGGDVVRFQNNQFAVLWKHPDGDRIHNFCAAADGCLEVFLNHDWVEITEAGMVETNYHEPDIQPLFPNGTRFWNGINSAPGEALISTVSGLARVQRGLRNPTYIGSFSERPVGLFLHDHSGRIWGQSKKNLVTGFEGTTGANFDLAAAASDVICAEEDAQGNLWLGTEDGLVQLQFQKARSITTRDGLLDDNVWTVCEEAGGRMWVGTDHSLAVLRGDHVEADDVPEIHPHGSVDCVWPAHDGGVWAMVRTRGLVKIMNGKITSRYPDIGLVNALYEDDGGQLWLGTSDGMLTCRNGQPGPAPPELGPLRDVHAIFKDHAGGFWFGAKDGTLASWRDNRLRILSTRDSFDTGGIWAIAEDPDGGLWLGTENGLVRFAQGRFFHFTPRQGMPADAVNCVLQDDSHNLWLSTLHGIYRVARAQLAAVADGKAEAAEPFIVGAADGMATAESNGEKQPAGWKARDGRLWFATGRGVAVVDPKLFSTAENPPRAHFESVKADGLELFTNIAGKIRIAAGHGHSLTFQFTACDLAAPEQVRFRTRLAGVDRDWSDPAAERQANYFDLPPGDYRLEILAVDHHGAASAPAALAFSIAPRFWQTFWFYTLCGVGVMALAAGVQGYRLRWQHRLLKLEQQRALAQERARIARDLHDDLGTALTGMALELDVLGREAQSSPPLVGRLARASQHIRHLAERMREVVWVVNPRCDNLRSLADFLEDQAALLLQAAGLKVRLDFPVEIPDLPVAANARHQLALSVREAFSNLIRHAHAAEASVSMKLEANKLVICVQDDGCGFDPQAELNKPHGLSNLRSRMEEIGGEFQVVSTPGDGTEIKFIMPLEKLKP